MRSGLVIALVGALGFVLASSGLEWQRYVLADVGATSFELGWGALLAALAAVVALGSAAFGLVSGRRALAANVGIGASLVALGWLLITRIDPGQGYELMAHETITAQAGFYVALLTSLLMLGGTLMTRASLATWDEAMPFLRVVALKGGRVHAETIAYEPQTIALRDFAGLSGGAVSVSREGDVVVRFDGPMTLNGQMRSGKVDVAIGDRVSLRSESAGDLTEIAVHHIAPVPGRRAAPILARSEIFAFAMLALLVHTSVFAVPVLGWQVDTKRDLPCEGGRCAGVVASVERVEEATDIEVVMADSAEELPETTSSKAAGGPEGVFGDPRISDPVVSKVPQRDGPMVERIDPRKVGLLALVDAKLGASDAVAEVLRGDMAATSRSIAAAMAGDGNEFVLGHGTNGLSWQGDGEGGPGDGTGRLMGASDIDTDGPGIKAALGDPPKRKRVGDLAMGTPTSSGFCSSAGIASVVKRRAAAIRACYEKRLQVKDGLKGKLSVRWTIGMDGKVMNASATSDSLGDSETSQCVMSWVRRMQFEKPEGGLCVVQWPFVFSNQ